MSDSTLGGNTDQIAAWLKVLVEPGSTVEMRVLNANGRPPHVRHYSSEDLLTTARDAVRFSKDAKGVYWLMNPLPAEWCGSPAKDTDIVRRRWLLIDCDPRREGTVSSTAEEKEAARAKVVALDQYLDEQGWPDPIIGDSGNGFHLLYRIDLPGDNGGLVHRVLQMLASQFDDEAVSIDPKVGNASRICKLYGTVSRKGEPTAERPHRLSGILTVPEQLNVVPIELLEMLAGEGDAQQAATGQPAPRPPAADRASYPAAIEQARKYLALMDASVEGDRHGEQVSGGVVMVTHLSKGSGGKAVYRAIGSLAFAAAARAVWHVAKDHGDDKRRLILLVKMNIATEATGLAYRLQDGVVCWDETPVVMTADEHLATETQPDRKPRGSSEQGEAVQQTAKWLVEKLTGCSMLSKGREATG